MRFRGGPIRFDNVISFGALLQLCTLVFATLGGGVTFYVRDNRQTEQLAEIQVTLDKLSTRTEQNLRDLDQRVRHNEIEIVRYAARDRFERLEQVR